MQSLPELYGQSGNPFLKANRILKLQILLSRLTQMRVSSINDLPSSSGAMIF